MNNKLYWLGSLTTCLVLVTAPALAAHSPTAPNAGYQESDLVSDLAATALHKDPRLVNPWGIVAGPGSIWVNDNGTGETTIYGPAGQPFAFTIFIPAPGGGAAAPSGLVFNNTHSFMVAKNGHQAPSTLLMSTEDGTITAWNLQVNHSNAVIVVDRSAAGAVYKGLALAQDANGHPQIYAANFHGGTVDIFNGNFQFVSSFTDSNLPANFAPFNVFNIDGYLMVSFALQKLPDAHDDQSGAGNGFIDIFDTDGTLLRRFASEGTLNSPWGMAVAPSGFGKFSGALLVGNFGDGKINAFDLLTGKWLGNLTRPNGSDLVIDGLWGLAFQGSSFDGESNSKSPRLYFASGLHDEADGLFGLIQPVNPGFPPAH